MKEHLHLVFLWLLLVAVVLGCSSPGSSKTYNIGDTGPAGGFIFYDQGSVINDWRYLECAPYGQNVSIVWFNGSYATTGATGTAVGTGRANTTAIFSSQGAGYYAANICKSLTLNGFSDWFLPSEGELDLMMQNLYDNGFGNFATAGYWSSTEASSTTAIEVAVNINGITVDTPVDKSNPFPIRAIREFAP